MPEATASPPRHTADIQDPDWLTAVMQASAPGCRVVGVEVIEETRVVATKSRLRLTYAPDRPQGIGALCVKAFVDTDAYQARLSWMSSVEARFYERLASRVPVCTPYSPYAAVDPTSGIGIILMEDLVAPGARFLSPLVPIGVDLIAQTVQQLARLHAAFSSRRELRNLQWLPPLLQTLSQSPSMDDDSLQHLLAGPRGSGLSPDVLDAARLHRALGLAVHIEARLPTTVLHGDCHCGNMFELPEGPGLLDWQLVQTGHWARDLAYHLGSSLTLDEGAAHECDLVDHYLECFRAAGGTPPSRGPAWDQYRDSVLYGYYMWLVTLRVPEDITVENCRRLGHAMMRHDTLDRIEHRAAKEAGL
jgi:hypothetical protein